MSTSECPVCKHPCQLGELRRLVISTKVPIGKKGRPKGALPKHYNTRSGNRNLSPESHSLLGNTVANVPQARIEESAQAISNIAIENNSPQLHNPTQSEDNNIASTIDYERINHMIETNIAKIFQNLHIVPTADNKNEQSSNCLDNSNIFEERRQPNINLPYFLSPMANSHSNSSTIHADKITSVIQNWNIKFDGSTNGLHVEEFLYRIRSLTRDTFNGDFSIICRNLHILLTGKARDWYWRYHKQVHNMDWNNFCDAFRSQYKQYRSSFDIREEIRNRKQKLGESFDSFFDAVLAIMDHLSTPMSDAELIEILARNLRPEIRQDLLYVPIHSISHLRKLVQMRENFLSEEIVRKNLAIRNQNPITARKYISEVDSTDDNNNTTHIDPDCTIDAINGNEIASKCWNCDEVGHRWENCLQQRSIFCYGCGAKNIYKPNCVKCAVKKQQQSKNFRTMSLQEKD